MFSEKYGFAPEKKIQIKTVSDFLKNRIWNVFYSNEIKAGGLSSPRLQQALTGQLSIEDMLLDRFGLTIDSGKITEGAEKRLKEYVLNSKKWYIPYDFIDLYLAMLDDEKKSSIIDAYNLILEQEKSAYRVVNGEVAPITNEAEIKTIEQACNSDYDSVNQHIRKSLEKYADRKNPDYENSIKEAISAVEAMCCIISGKDATLNKAIAELKKHGVHIHPCLESAFKSMYNYTSDEKGIRHAGIDFVNAPAEDAKYMLVSCSAFVNYLIEKWTKNNGG